MLTGRANDFTDLRKRGHVGGFPMPEESPYDLFAVGHAGTAISTAVGMARGDQMQGRRNHVVAVVGDASIVNGVALEGLNGAGTLDRQLLIILNDNGMSISEPQGAFSEYLERVRVSTTYNEFKRVSEKLVRQMPHSVGHAIEHAWDSIRGAVKGAMWHGAMFETFGLKYMGPIDGHDLPGLINFLAEIKHVDRPVLLHVKTTKGKGYEPVIKEPTKLHSPGAFNIEGGDGPELVGCRIEIKGGSGKSWTNAFADAVIAAAKEDPRVVALTAAMPDGTGLSKFGRVLPDRYIDTGICESHLTDLAAGLAKTGMKPVAAIYSTFIQRAFDQVWQEVILNRLPVVFCMDRAGFVGDDGAVHHGFMDQSFLRPLPDIVLMAPSDEADLNRMLRLGLSLDVASAIRYPRDNVPATDFSSIDGDETLRLGHSRTLRQGADLTLIGYGSLVQSCLDAADRLANDGIDAEVIDARFCKPLDEAMLRRVLTSGRAVLTVEDHITTGGFGAAILELAQKLALPTDRLTILGHPPDRLIAHAKRAEQLTEVGLDPAGLTRSAKNALQSIRSTERSTSPVV
jgi:1-deoxy-D-xylulose-5-phosphate synthase